MTSILKKLTFKHKKDDEKARPVSIATKSPEPEILVTGGPSHERVSGPNNEGVNGPNHERVTGPSHERVTGPSHERVNGSSHERAGGRARAQSDASGFSRRSKAATLVSKGSSMDDGSASHNPPHYIMYHMDRRMALGPEELCRSLGSMNAIFGSGEQLDGGRNEAEPVMTIILCPPEGCNRRELMKPRVNQSLRELIEEAMIKNGYDIESLSTTSITAMQNGSSIGVNLDTPSHQYHSSTVEVAIPGEERRKDESPMTTYTIKDCLDHFSHNGLVELPNSHCDEDSYHLPRVDRLESVPHSWNDLPIPADVKSRMSMKQLELQQKIWELIATEHSHLNHLKTVINLFMQSLELIRRAHLLVEDSYHNVFGYMEDIHNAHEDLWNHTLLPCVEKTLRTGCLLDMDEVLQRFPPFSSHFDIYRQHCPLESLNLQALTKAMLNQDFEAYINWCESHHQCKRLRLKDFLAMPMQRLTKYPLLLGAILKALPPSQQKEALTKICDEVKDFVQSVNSVVRIQEETERVRDAMTRISDYVMMDNLPPKLKDEFRSHKLDLLAPMPGVEVDQPRMLLLEGSLKYRDQYSALVVHVFLFTDLMLITKPAKNKYIIVKPPYKITSIVLQTLEPDTIGVVVLGDYLDVVSTWFILKASSESIVKSWIERITSAQHLYRDALERQEVNWRTIQCLRSERILNGIEKYPADFDYDQSRWSIHSNTAEPEVAEGIIIPHHLPSNLNLTRTRSAGTNDSSLSTSTMGTRSREHSSTSEAILSPRIAGTIAPAQPRHLSIPMLQPKVSGTPRQGRRAYSVDAGTQTDLFSSMPQRSSSSFGSMDVSNSSGSTQELTAVSSGTLDQLGFQGPKPSKCLHGEVNQSDTTAAADTLVGEPPCLLKSNGCDRQQRESNSTQPPHEGSVQQMAPRRPTLKKCIAYDKTPPPQHSPPPHSPPYTPTRMSAGSHSPLPLLHVEDCSNTSPTTDHFTWDIVMLNYPTSLASNVAPDCISFVPSTQLHRRQPEPDSKAADPGMARSASTQPLSKNIAPWLKTSMSLIRAQSLDSGSQRKKVSQIPVPVRKLSKDQNRTPRLKTSMSTLRAQSLDSGSQRKDLSLPVRKLSKTSPRMPTSECPVPTSGELFPDPPAKVSSPTKTSSRRSSKEEGAGTISKEQAALRYRAGSFRRVQRVGRQGRPGSGGDRKHPPTLPDFDIWLRSQVRRSHRGKGVVGGGKALTMSPSRKVSTDKAHKSLLRETSVDHKKLMENLRALEMTVTPLTSKGIAEVAKDMVEPEGVSSVHSAPRLIRHTTSVGRLPVLVAPYASDKRARSAIPVRSPKRSLSLEFNDPRQAQTSQSAISPLANPVNRPPLQKAVTVPPVTVTLQCIMCSQPTLSTSTKDGSSTRLTKVHADGSERLKTVPQQSANVSTLEDTVLPSFQQPVSLLAPPPVPEVTPFQATKPLHKLKEDPPHLQHTKSSSPNDTKMATSAEGHKPQSVAHPSSPQPLKDTPTLPSKATTNSPSKGTQHTLGTNTQEGKAFETSNIITQQRNGRVNPVPTKETTSEQNGQSLPPPPSHIPPPPSHIPPPPSHKPNSPTSHKPPPPPSHKPPPHPSHHHDIPPPPSHPQHDPLSPPSASQHYQQSQQSSVAPSSQKRHAVFQMSHRRHKSYPAMLQGGEEEDPLVQPAAARHHHGTTHRTMETKGLRPSSLTYSGLLSIEEEGAWSPIHATCNSELEAKSM